MRIFRQVLAIAHTEFRFGLRRGGPVVTTALIGLIVGAGILIQPLGNLSISKDDMNQFLQDPAKIAKLAEKGITIDNFRRIEASVMGEITALSVDMAWPILLLTAFLLLPTATASTLPADRKFGIAELLHSTPVGGGIYLAGKILGVALTVLLIGLIPLALFFGVLAWLFLSTYQVGVPVEVVWFFIKFSLMDGLPILIWGLTIGILSGTIFHSRRAAVLPGLGAGILSIFFWLAAFKAPAQSFLQTDVAAYYLLQTYHSSTLEAFIKLSGMALPSLLGDSAPIIGLGQVLVMYLIILASITGLFSLARLWLKWKENF